MDESRNADERPEQTPDNMPPLPDDASGQRPAGGMGLGSCLLVIGGIVVLFLLFVPTTGSRPATRSEKLETQRREQLIEQAMRDAQAAEQSTTVQAAIGEPEFAASNRTPHDRVPQDIADDAR